MKYFLYIFIVFASVLLFESCDEDSFSQVVTIDIPEHEPKLVLNGGFSAEMGWLNLKVSNSKGILDKSEYEVFENADVRLYKNDILANTLEFTPDYVGYFGLFNSDLETDSDTYRVEVEVDGYEPVQAEQVMPLPAEIVSASYELEGAVSPDGDRVNSLKVKIKDPAGIDNYYAFFASYSAGANSRGLYLESVDPLVSNGDSQDILVSGESFDGKSYELSFYTYDAVDLSAPDAKIDVFVYSITRDGYYYEKSLFNYYNNEDNPFAEPIVVHSNIENGYGIFWVNSINSFTIEE